MSRPTDEQLAHFVERIVQILEPLNPDETDGVLESVILRTGKTTDAYMRARFSLFNEPEDN
jgi:hypothetical protein